MNRHNTTTCGDRPTRSLEEDRKRGKGRRRSSKGDTAAKTPSLPVISMEGGELPAVVDAAEAALMAAKVPFYQRGGMIVRPALQKITVTDNHEAMAWRLVEIKRHAVAEEMTRSAQFRSWDSRREDWTTVNCPLLIAETYLCRTGQWKLPILQGMITAPTLRPDGSILQTPGYDQMTGFLYHPAGVDFPTVPDRPTRKQAADALGELRFLFETFDFVSDADRAVALSAVLTVMVRPSLASAPLHGFSAPVAGSGKSMLVDLMSIIATGRQAGVISQGKNEEEQEKRLGAAFIAGDPIISIDNCEGGLGGELLCSALTQSTLKLRILGRSVLLEVPSCSTLFATGNNLTFVGDMVRRALLSTLDPRCERPELREFESSALAYARNNRARLAVAALTVMRAYYVAGRPPQKAPIGSFEDWSRWVRDPLLWLGAADPCETIEQVRAGDPKLAALSAVISQWATVIGEDRVSVKDVIEIALQSSADGFPPYKRCLINSDFVGALLNVADDKGAINGKRLGAWLSRHKGQFVDGRRIEPAGKRSGDRLWKLTLM